LRQDASGDGVYIILITSRDSKQDLLEGLTAGADDYLVKPFDAKELRARLRIGERVVQRLERLEERERTLQDFIDNAVELIQLVDADGHFIYVNQAWRECLDYSDAEVAQLKIWDIVHPDSQDYCQALFGRILQGEEVGLIETKFIT
jgi:PleD family two-component response regulator